MAAVRRAAAVVAMLACAAPAAAAPAGTSPFAGEIRSASTAFQLGGRDGRTWIVRLTLDELHPAGGDVSRTFDVSFKPCTVDRTKTVRCAAETTYRGEVAPGAGAVAEDLRTASLHARIGSSRLDVTWSVSDSYAIALSTLADGEITVRHARAGGTGLVRGVVFGPACSANGSVGGGYVVRTSGPPARSDAAPLPAGLPAALAAARGWAPRCV